MSTDIRRLTGVDPRVETGPIQFGDDWPGTFIRGDNAFHYAFHLKLLLDNMAGGEGAEHLFMSVAVLRGLLSDLQGSRI
jgi:hypothetical protein